MYVYCINNYSSPEYIKIGFSSRNPELVAKDMCKRAPLKYNVVFYIRGTHELMKEFHKIVGSKYKRHNEWFKCNPKDIKELFKSRGELIETECDIQEILQEQNKFLQDQVKFYQEQVKSLQDQKFYQDQIKFLQEQKFYQEQVKFLQEQNKFLQEQVNLFLKKI
jgi:hypothetical protein